MSLYVERAMRLVLGVFVTPATAKDNVYNHPSLKSVPETLKVSSSAFTDGSPIPWVYGGHKCVGASGRNPPFSVDPSTLPAGTKYLALVIEDPSTPMKFPITHALFYNYPASKTDFKEGEIIEKGSKELNVSPCVVDGVNVGKGHFGFRGYGGPAPLVGDPPHEYYFQIYALSDKLPEELSINEFAEKMAPVALAKGQIMGTFQRTWKKH